jgi:hypothetical protein
MAEPLRHRQTKEAATDMFSLQPPRHIPTLPCVPAIEFLLDTPGDHAAEHACFRLVPFAEKLLDVRPDELIAFRKLPRGTPKSHFSGGLVMRRLLQIDRSARC